MLVLQLLSSNVYQAIEARSHQARFPAQDLLVPPSNPETCFRTSSEVLQIPLSPLWLDHLYVHDLIQERTLCQTVPKNSTLDSRSLFLQINHISLQTSTQVACLQGLEARLIFELRPG